jgi:hypothetical protein
MAGIQLHFSCLRGFRRRVAIRGIQGLTISTQLHPIVEVIPSTFGCSFKDEDRGSGKLRIRRSIIFLDINIDITILVDMLNGLI